MNKYEKRFNQICEKFQLGAIYFSNEDLLLQNKKCCLNTSWEYSSAFTSMRKIQIPEIKGPHKEEIFATALHELGHLIAFNMTKSKKAKTAREQRYNWSIFRKIVTKNRLYEEFIAWVIAKYLAGKMWNDKMAIVLSVSMSQYIAAFEITHPKQKYLSTHQQYMLLGGYNIKCPHIKFNRHNFLKLLK